jgi:hypothetical protein
MRHSWHVVPYTSCQILTLTSQHYLSGPAHHLAGPISGDATLELRKRLSTTERKHSQEDTPRLHDEFPRLNRVRAPPHKSGAYTAPPKAHRKTTTWKSLYCLLVFDVLVTTVGFPQGPDPWEHVLMCEIVLLAKRYTQLVVPAGNMDRIMEH